ncbi:uncharacterized protein EDB93DRAFT_676100 [Suillus bovinus]|uniref:uncharacterized protein n=1 Tax=Suillus bovinus TaxID=48563 RepID=UPI001B8689BA|nr:uncharacterized protein EDB93DRAFT_676100 [Suillus bovinus]KAG2140497.1 hypothetical protein EDB93DRAFT_676100 [Suillus bovinus]
MHMPLKLNFSIIFIPFQSAYTLCKVSPFSQSLLFFMGAPHESCTQISSRKLEEDSTPVMNGKVSYNIMIIQDGVDHVLFDVVKKPLGKANQGLVLSLRTLRPMKNMLRPQIGKDHGFPGVLT